ncbi:MAG: hypothetical protein HOP12_02465 [Candidatus Eisenbacteria bacterium]|uniref:T9SS type A sorting domain-containing protein n=1 Tax=Eiseniibacteriota bacterium TaxID=2212470 RepID=A0A849SHH5_UNCEI|nr:hypothetical protein [Candidatus Eisenbacteria bacterium]
MRRLLVRLFVLRVPLGNGGQISGATSPLLTIQDACDPNTGSYDALVGSGPIVEPSRPVRLDIGTATGVELELARPRSLSIELAGPSPFTSQTAFRLVAPHAERGPIAIYDVSRARIRTLADRVEASTGIVTWDGRTSAGTRAPAGIYFLRVAAGAMHGTCRVVLLN